MCTVCIPHMYTHRHALFVYRTCTHTDVYCLYTAHVHTQTCTVCIPHMYTHRHVLFVYRTCTHTDMHCIHAYLISHSNIACACQHCAHSGWTHNALHLSSNFILPVHPNYLYKTYNQRAACRKRNTAMTPFQAILRAM